MSRIEELENEIKGLENRKIELLKELEVEKQKKIEYPFKYGDKYFLLSDNGIVVDAVWEDYNFDNDALSQGNAFEIEEEAEKERDRRALLKRFRQFRDKCNGERKPNLKIVGLPKYCIAINNKTDVMFAMNVTFYNEFNPFGYFEKKEDCNRAIQLFGDEIKRLYVEE